LKTRLVFRALSRPSPVLLCLLGLLPFGSFGCAGSSAPNLKITSIGQNQCWEQTFTQAWMNRNANGEYDVVLVDQATEQAMHGGSFPEQVRQVMHIRVLWSTTRDMKAVVSNASVKWYVIGKSHPQDVLEYSGLAFVYMDEGDDHTTLKIRNAVLNPSTRHGQLTDPVGSSRLEGSFVARQNQENVNKVLASLKTTLAAATQTPSAPAAVGVMPTGKAE
jgi:hypothetical protein